MDPAEPEHPGPPQDDGPGPSQSEAPGPPPDEAPGPHQNEAPGPLQNEAPDPPQGEAPGPPQSGAPDPPGDEAPGPAQSEAAGPPGDETPGPPPGDTQAPRPDEAAVPSEGKALGPLQYGDASSPLHKAPSEEPARTPEEPARTPEEPGPAPEEPAPTPEPAPKQLIGTIPPAVNLAATTPSATIPAGGKRSRRKKILAWTSGVLAGVLVIGVLGAYFVYRHLDANLHQVDISGVLGSQPVDLHPQAENILILGSDTRVGQGGGFGSSAVLNTDHSDTLLVVHIAADRQWADVMSIPRDSWVSIPACMMGNGQMSSATTFKINEAFTLGTLDGNKTALGVACTIRTVEKNTGIRIDHFVVVNFTGFRDMVNAVGGVPECNTKPINDPLSGLRLSAGHHLLRGWRALAYVRARYTLGNGSDLERIGRQQAFMSSLVDRVKSKLLDPVAIYRFLDAATKSLTIDDQLGGIKGLYNMATSLKSLPPSRVTFFTLPTYPRSYVDPTDTADVMWTQPEDSQIFQAFRNDMPVSKDMLKYHPPPAIAPDSVTLDVLNGSGAGGLEYTVAAVLQQDGFKVKRTGNAGSQDVTQTLIKYHAGQLQQAQLLAGKVHGAALQEVPGTGQVTLVLGSNYGSTANAGPRTTPQPASSFAPRTANENICT
jgi:LCP family protein required for cell wall assembly